MIGCGHTAWDGPGNHTRRRHPIEHQATAPLGHYLTEKEAGLYTRWSPKTLRNMRYLGTGPEFLRIGRSIRYTKPALDAFMNSGSQQGGEAA